MLVVKLENHFEKHVVNQRLFYISSYVQTRYLYFARPFILFFFFQKKKSTQTKRCSLCFFYLDFLRNTMAKLFRLPIGCGGNGRTCGKQKMKNCFACLSIK